MRTRDENKEALIRQKAIEMIVKKGFDGLSMQKLAKAAKVSPATIYIYFRDREDLVNQLYIECEKDFAETVLASFDPEMHFKEGLWQQWKNRYTLILKDPYRFYFMEQFRNSPLIRHKDVKENTFRETMMKFVKNAIKRKELIELPVETYWSLAYGPFYSLIKFHLNQKFISGRPFILTEEKMKHAFNLVLRSLQP
ncbi:MAG: TetR/AcrR family transcriptional regulator [Bacteroidetes bacterium]|nr:TetR/AcrR family transcriptional regulator [Bacteroidota bacterium]